MSDIFTTIATTLAKQGAPVLGGLIGTAIGGPAGAAVGGLAGKAIEAVAEALGVAAKPEAVAEALAKPGAADAVVSLEQQASILLPLWQAQLAMAAQAQTAEIEKGFNSWNWRRNFAHYTAWFLPLLTGGSATWAFLFGLPSAPAIAGLFASATALAIAWTAANSGGKAVTDAVWAWRGGQK